MICVKRIRKVAAFLLIAAVLMTMSTMSTMTKASAAGAASSAGIVSSSVGGLNVRSTASTTGTILRQLVPGSYITLLSRSGNWWKVEYAPSSYGYASADYISAVPGAYTVAVSNAVSMLNVRSGPGTSSAIIGTITGGQTVIVLSENAGWERILANGSLVGYASAQYLKAAVLWPVPSSHKINQYFSDTHMGIDIGSSVHGVQGDPVVAAMGGKVVYAGTLNGYGYVVYIDSWYNGQPVQTRYGHLESLPLVQAGTSIAAGQKLGAMGNTGESTGAHLHFEFRIRKSSADCIANTDSTTVNPLGYIS
jgi:murein DD-endopeptidase MepM/ murein hydrolase activator NlpD